MRQRRWAERGRFDPVVGPQQQAKRNAERLRQRLLLIGAAVVAVVVIVLVGAGLYLGVYAPPRHVVAKVGDTTVRTRDVVPYVLLGANGQNLPSPATAFTTLLRNDIILQRAGSLGVSVSTDDVNKQVVKLIDPPADPNAPVPATLTSQGKSRLQAYLNFVHMDENSYREYVKAELLFSKMQERFTALQPAEADQVAVHWIIAKDTTDAQTAKDRLDKGELFATVAADLNVGIGLADKSGNLGWVPKGAFPDLDSTFFDKPQIGKAVGPINSSVGPVVVVVDKGPEKQPLSDQMRNILASNAFQNWMTQQVQTLVTKTSFRQQDSDWINNHLQ